MTRATLIEQIKEQLTIADCLSHFGAEVPPRGRDPVMARCPWHEDRTPSLAVYRLKGRAWCYGCNEGGDVLDVSALCMKGDIREAVRYWANRLGLETGTLNPEERRRLAGEAEERRERRRIRKACHAFSHGIEQGLPRPHDTDFLGLWDYAFSAKDAIDERYWNDGGPADRAAARSYIALLQAWRKRWEGLLPEKIPGQIKADTCGRNGRDAQASLKEKGGKREAYRLRGGSGWG